jgi:glutamate 5-kinase
VRTVIAAASRPGVLDGAIRGAEGTGTQFLPHDMNLPARKLWIAFAAQSTGTVVVDRGAREALTSRHSSLLHAGVLEVRGDFAAGDTVEVVGPDGAAFARGMVAVDATRAAAAAGRTSESLPEDVPSELIHRDDLVILAAR